MTGASTVIRTIRDPREEADKREGPAMTEEEGTEYLSADRLAAGIHYFDHDKDDQDKEEIPLRRGRNKRSVEESARSDPRSTCS